MKIDKKYIINDLNNLSSKLPLSIEIIDADNVDVVEYGIILTKDYGQILFGSIDNKICYLGFVVGNSVNEAVDKLCKRWEYAQFIRDDRKISTIFKNVFNDMNIMDIVLSGTKFQINVWKSLCLIPEGEVTTYGLIAKYLKNELAVRAVGTAIGNNPISILIPCHRVIKSNREIGNYLWGRDVKFKILKLETKNISH